MAVLFAEISSPSKEERLMDDHIWWAIALLSIAGVLVIFLKLLTDDSAQKVGRNTVVSADGDAVDAWFKEAKGDKQVAVKEGDRTIESKP
jgi:hypothetical protein